MQGSPVIGKMAGKYWGSGGFVYCIGGGNRVCFDPFQIALTIYRVNE